MVNELVNIFLKHKKMTDTRACGFWAHAARQTHDLNVADWIASTKTVVPKQKASMSAYGYKRTLWGRASNVRFTPESGHCQRKIVSVPESGHLVSA